MTDDGGQWVTVAQAAQALGVIQRTVRRWAQAGKLPIRRDCRPHVVNIAGQTPDGADATAGELEALQAEVERLRERVQELVKERDYLRMLAGTLAQGQRRMLEARPRRRWRWPWQRGPSEGGAAASGLILGKSRASKASQVRVWRAFRGPKRPEEAQELDRRGVLRYPAWATPYMQLAPCRSPSPRKLGRYHA